MDLPPSPMQAPSDPTQELHVLWVTQAGPDSLESSANRIRKLSRGLSALGAKVDWMFPPEAVDQSKIATQSPAKLTSQPMAARNADWAPLPLNVSLPPQGASIAFKAWRTLAILIAIKRGVKNLLTSNLSAKKSEIRVIVSLPPAWALIAAYWISRLPECKSQTQSPLVLDYRDPVINPKLNPRPAWLDAFLRAIEKKLLRRTRAILSSPLIGEMIPPAAATQTVYSGFEPHTAPPSGPIGKPSSELRILYGGTFYGSRSPLPIAQAINELIKGQNTDVSHFRFIFYCQFNSSIDEQGFRDYLREHHLEAYFQIHGLISRERFLAEISCSDIVLILTHSEGSEYAIPGKVFDYLAFERRMLIFSTDRALLEMIDQYQLQASTCAPTPSAIAQTLTRMPQTCSHARPPHGLSSAAQARILADFLV